MPSIMSHFEPRQYRECLLDADGYIDENSCYVPFWYTKNGHIVKWSLFLGLILFICLYLTIGYFHAKKRIRQGRPPLAYHRFLVPRSQLAQTDPRYRWPNAATPVPYYPNAGPGGAYGMHNMPPPVYDPNAARPPVYPGPPEGGSKVDPNQQQPMNAEPSPSYTAAPPPQQQTTGVTDGGNNNNPYRL